MALLEAVRNSYVSSLSSAVRASPGAHIEPVYRMSDGLPALEGLLSLPARADLIPTRGEGAGRPLMVNSAAQLEFEPVPIGSFGPGVSVSSFTWDSLTVRVRGLPEQEVASRGAEWFVRWFDADDTNGPTSEGLYGVVHFMSEPASTGGWVEFSADLGSAPVAALEDLLPGE